MQSGLWGEREAFQVSTENTQKTNVDNSDQGHAYNSDTKFCTLVSRQFLIVGILLEF